MENIDKLTLDTLDEASQASEVLVNVAKRTGNDIDKFTCLASYGISYSILCKEMEMDLDHAIELIKIIYKGMKK